MGGNGPAMSEWILDHPVAIPPEHVVKRHDDLRAYFDGPVDDGVGILDKKDAE